MGDLPKEKEKSGLIVMGDLPRWKVEGGLIIMGDLPKWKKMMVSLWWVTYPDKKKHGELVAL